MKRKKPDRKARPANEITEQEVENFLSAIRNFDGYPRLRDLGRLLPSMSDYKINVVLRFLERSKMIIVDNDGFITWVRKDRPDDLTLGDVANIDEELKAFLSKNNEN
jgi:hypothetical protein